jgi:hypothetical protein
MPSTAVFHDSEDCGRTVVLMLNQLWLEQSWRDEYPRVNEDQLQMLDESWIRDISDRAEVVKFVLKNCPEKPVVYPSEQYYYFKFIWKHRRISGNLRFCDAARGLVHFGYFDEFDASFMKYGSIENGVNGKVNSNKTEVLVGFQNIEKRFVLDSAFLEFDDPKTSPDEQIVSGVLDESGYGFFLLYNKNQRLFYYVLHESRTPEPMFDLKLSSVEMRVGVHSRFVFFLDRELNRFVLIGVLAENIKRNNYYDGPFDQVPPELEIRESLEHVYPYLKLRKIDSHGNFTDETGARVAISPYIVYRSIPEITAIVLASIEYLDSGSGALPAFFNLVRESKGVSMRGEVSLPETGILGNPIVDE